MSDRDSIFSRAAVSAGAAAAEDWAAASDAELFRHYQTMPGGEVFRVLASRHLPLIWSTARRLVNGDAALAEDVTQIVLTDFARKAPQLPPGTVAAGWLHRHTCFIARKMVRTEVRRRHREHRAADFATAADSSSFSSFATTPAAAGTPFFEPMTTDSESAAAWPEAAPLLDVALDQLVKADREAILLRFYQRQDHRSIGQAMGCTEEAARKRIARALEKLRTLFRRRGVLLTAALLTQYLTDHATAAVPAPVAAALPGMAWRQATLTGPVTAFSAATAWFRRCLLPGAAVVAILAGGVWAIAESGWFSGQRTHSPPSSAGNAEGASGKPAAGSPDLLFRYTVANVPANALAARLLTYQISPANDAALLAELTGLSKAGGSLEDFELSGPLNRELRLEKTRGYDYSDDWVWDQESDTGKAVESKTETKALGTHLSSTARELEHGGIELTWQWRHHYARPETHSWPISLEKSAKDPARGIQVEDFHEVAGGGRIGNLRENEPRLLFIQELPSAVQPDAQPGPRTLVLFVTLNPS